MQGRLKNSWTVWPAYLLLAVLCWEVLLNLYAAMQPAADAAAQDGLPVSPEFAFNWLQVAAGGGMWLVLTWAVLLLAKSLRFTANGTELAWNLPRTLAALTVLLFALPSWWLWFWTVVDWFSGRQNADLGNWHYVLAALCQPFLLFLPLQVWLGQRRLRRFAAFRQPEREADWIK